MHVDGPIEGLELLAKHLFGQQILADDLARAAQQALQQAELGGVEVQQLIVAAGQLQARLQHQIHEAQFVGCAALG